MKLKNTTHMFTPEIESSLIEIKRHFGQQVMEYIRKVAAAEKRSINGADPEDLIASAYIVLSRAKDSYDETLGEFRNYAIRSLRNEFLRMKSSPELLYDDFQDDSGTSSFQASATDEPFVYQSASRDPVVTSLQLDEFNEVSVVFIAALNTSLTALEKTLIYLMYYSSDNSRRPSLRKLSEEHNLSYYLLLVTLKKALAKLRQALDNTSLSQKDILEMLKS